MSDLVERLRGEGDIACWQGLADEAAAEIERLRAELDKAHRLCGELIKDGHDAAVTETVIHALRANRDDAEAEIERLQSCLYAQEDVKPLYDEIERLRASNKQLLEALEDLVAAVTTEVNEKGGGGFILARLTDARAAIKAATGE